MAQREQNVRLIELGVAQVNINAVDQGLALAALAQEAARTRVKMLTIAVPQDDGAAGVELSTPTINDLTDSTTGTAAATLVAVPVAVADVNPTSGPTKASFDTQIGLVEDAHEELVDQINLFIGAVAGNTARTCGATAGAASDGTLAAIAAFTNGVDDLTDPVTGNQQIVIARNNQAALCAGLNYVRVAMGLAPITDTSGGVFTVDADEYVLVDQAATGAAAAEAGDASLTAASALASLNALKNNIATLAETLNAMSGAELAIGPFVVATRNPRTRFLGADITA